MGPSLGANRPCHRHRPHGGHRPAAGWWWIFPPKNSPTKPRSISRESREPAYLQAVRAFTLAGVPELPDAAAALGQLLAWPTIASKNWVYRQYDHMVRDGSVVCPGSDAAVIRIKEDSLPVAPAPGGPAVEKFIAMTVDCNAAYVYLDPYEGAQNRRGRSRPQSRLFRRRAPGRDGQSQFRQPAQPGTLLAAQGIRARPGRGLPRLPCARHRRQLQPLQPKPQRPH